MISHRPPQPMNSSTVKPVSELRSLLEGFAARNAALRATDAPQECKKLRQILQSLLGTLRTNDYAAFQKADAELHETILTMAKVPLLVETWRPLWNHLLGLHQLGCNSAFPDARVLAQEHEHLVETICLGDPNAAEDAARSHVDAVWLRLTEQSITESPQAVDPLQRTAAYLAFQMHADLRLPAVARNVACTSPGHLSRLFKQHFGASFQAYLQKIRIQKAADLLITTQIPISRIARRVGYRDPARFGQHFRRHIGTTPTLHRSQNSLNHKNQTPA